MDLNLEDGGANASIAEKVDDEGTLEVGNANGFGKADVNQMFHRLPCLLNGGFALDDFAL